MSFPWIVALRFLREGRMQSVLIVGGVAVGVAVMVFLSALITGLQQSLVDQTLGTQAHIVVRSADDVARPQLDRESQVVAAAVEQPAQRLKTVANWPKLVAELKQTAGVTAVSPVISGPAFAIRGAAQRTVVLRGIDPDSYPGIVPLDQRVVAGAYGVSGVEVLVGVDLAEELGIGPGDKMRIANAQGQSASLTVSGLFDLDNKAVNASWVFVALRSAQTLLDIPGEITAVELRVAEIFEADAVAAVIAGQTGLVAESWMQLNSQLLVALRSQSSSSYMIQFFVILAVALGIASVLIVSVVQKSKEIGILKAMGAQTGDVTRVFIIQGFLVGLAGSLVGVAMGIGLSVFFASLATNPDGSARFPVDLNLALYLRSMLIASLTGVLASVAPARRAARLDPAVVIRNG